MSKYKTPNIEKFYLVTEGVLSVHLRTSIEESKCIHKIVYPRTNYQLFVPNLKKFENHQL